MMRPLLSGLESSSVRPVDEYDKETGVYSVRVEWGNPELRPADLDEARVYALTLFTLGALERLVVVEDSKQSRGRGNG